MRRAAKVDANQPSVVAALEAEGFDVLSLAAVGNGCMDLLVHKEYFCSEHRFWLLEVKNLSGRGKKLTDDQIKFHAKWPVTVVTTPEDALAAVGL